MSSEGLGPLKVAPRRIERVFTLTGGSTYEETVLQAILQTGFYVGAIPDAELHGLCQEIDHEVVGTGRMSRPYEQELHNDVLRDKTQQIMNNSFLREICLQYFGRRCKTKCVVKRSFPTKNLAPCEAALYHRDLQSTSLKLLIYLTDVNVTNGALRIVHPEARI